MLAALIIAPAALAFGPAAALPPLHTCARAVSPTMQIMPPPWRGEPDRPPLVERCAAVAVYSLPLADGFEYGSALYNSIPGLYELAHFVVAPYITAFHMIPFSGLLYFLAFSYFVHSSSLSRFVTFNIQQALFLDMVLLVPYLFPEAQNWLLHVGGPLPLTLLRLTLFWLTASVLAHAALSNVKGDLPDKVPILSSATREYLKNLGM